MSTHVTRSITTPVRKELKTAADIWDHSDKGLIFCWEKGREEREQKPDLAERAERGELVTVGQLGGEKYGMWKRGSLQYLAWWQGLRGEDLNVSFVAEIEIICPRIFVGTDGKKHQRLYDFPGGTKPPYFRDLPVK
ncbi:MAG TPA: hypothetical protein VFG04_25220 [Planctomycetaceae bacterium]|jgi:hypothetical protein|nr:hypothetical protein [Planctomycetaceae bacterium]